MPFTWLLNPLTWDVLIASSGKVRIVYGDEEVRQRIEVTLNHHFGEYFLNTQHGLPWYQTQANEWSILGSKDYKTVEMIVKSAVLDVPGVIGLVSMDITLPRASNSRQMSIGMQVEVQGQISSRFINIGYTVPLYMGDLPVLIGRAYVKWSGSSSGTFGATAGTDSLPSRVVQGDVDANDALDIAKGGTNAITSTDARTNLGLGSVERVFAEASEDLVTGNFVNLYEDSGAVKVRKADCSLEQDAYGFVLADWSTGDTVTIYLSGQVNTSCYGMTPGMRQYLSTNGLVVDTPPTTSGYIVQFLGVASTSTDLLFLNDSAVILA